MKVTAVLLLLAVNAVAQFTIVSPRARQTTSLTTPCSTAPGTQTVLPAPPNSNLNVNITVTNPQGATGIQVSVNTNAPFLTIPISQSGSYSATVRVPLFTGIGYLQFRLTGGGTSYYGCLDVDSGIDATYGTAVTVFESRTEGETVNTGATVISGGPTAPSLPDRSSAGGVGSTPGGLPSSVGVGSLGESGTGEDNAAGLIAPLVFAALGLVAMLF